MVSNLFGLSHTVTLYYLSNTLFEGEAAAQPKAQRGHSNEKRKDCPLFTLVTLIGAVVVVLGGLFGRVRLVVAQLYTETQAVNGRLDRVEAEIRAGREETMTL